MAEYRVSLRAARITAGLTLEEAGKLIGKNGGTVRRWEIGESEPKYEDIRRLCKVYNVPMEVIFLHSMSSDT